MDRDPSVLAPRLLGGDVHVERAPEWADLEIQHGAQVWLERDPDQGGDSSHVHHSLIDEYPARIPRICAGRPWFRNQPLYPPTCLPGALYDDVFR